MDDISTLLDELSSYQNKKNTPQPIHTERQDVPTDENLNDYILKRASTLIDMSLESVAELKPYVSQACNPDEIAALAELVNSTAKAIETLNKINIQRRKSQDDIKLKEIDQQFKKEMNSLPSNSPTVNNNVFVASREEIFKKFISDNSQEVVLDSEIKE